MEVSELTARLQAMPSDLDILIPTENGVDKAGAAYTASVVKTAKDCGDTSVGNYHLIDEDALEAPDSEPFQGVVIDFEGQLKQRY